MSRVAESFAILCGNASRVLATDVARGVGIPLGEAVVERFPDGEVSVEIREPVRDKDVFVISRTAPSIAELFVPPTESRSTCSRKVLKLEIGSPHWTISATG